LDFFAHQTKNVGISSSPTVFFFPSLSRSAFLLAMRSAVSLLSPEPRSSIPFVDSEEDEMADFDALAGVEEGAGFVGFGVGTLRSVAFVGGAVGRFARAT
jgi:hypothetical protein